MAATLKDIKYNTRICKFIIDSDADVELLPKRNEPGKGELSTVVGCNMGSIAYVISDNANYYILNGNNEWVKKPFPSGGGGGGSSESYDFATDQDIFDLFGKNDPNG